MTNLLDPRGGDVVSTDSTESPPLDARGEKEDGRSLRRQRNRAAVINALIELVREGDLAPTVGRIADRAELSHRSVFRYFDDLDDLARTAIETEFRAAWPLSRVDDVGTGPLEERIERLVDAQIRSVERIHQLGLVARARAHENDEVEHGLRRIFDLHLEQIRAHFAPELDGMDADRANAVGAAIAVSTSLDGYDVLHRTAGHSPDEVAAMWRTALAALLD